MTIDIRRGRELVLTEPVGIVRALGSLLIVTALLSLCRGLLMLHWHEHTVGFGSVKFWLYITIATLVLGLAFSSPPRWRWIFDIDLNSIRSYRLRFNIPDGEGQTLEFAGMDRAEVVQRDDKKYVVELVDRRAFRTQVDGVRSSRPGWPNAAAERINAVLSAYKQSTQSESSLNDPANSLKEVGILGRDDLPSHSPALLSLKSSLPADVLALTSDANSACRITGAIANHFRAVLTEDLDLLNLNSYSDLQMLLLFDLCSEPMKSMPRPQYLALSARVLSNDSRSIGEGLYAFALDTRFRRLVAPAFEVTNIEPPAGNDLTLVLDECKTVIATVAAVKHAGDRPLNPPKTYHGKEVVYVDSEVKDRTSLVASLAYSSGIVELSPDLGSEWHAPAESADALRHVLNKIERAAPLPMRNVLMRACVRALNVDGLFGDREWVMARAVADLLHVSLPPTVAEPVYEARLDVIQTRP